MAVRFEGTLKRWNDDRGFGFIVLLQSGQEVFVHVSAFASAGTRPEQGDAVSFEIEAAADGKQRAVRVWRLSLHADTQIETQSARPERHPASPRIPVGRSGGERTTGIWLLAVLLAGAAAWGYHAYTGQQRSNLVSPQPSFVAPPEPIRMSESPATAAAAPLSALSTPRLQPVRPVTAQSALRFSCDGRTHCSQMRSCAEATYFLKHCPGAKMDGNNDGIPCEQQWCIGPFAD